MKKLYTSVCILFIAAAAIAAPTANEDFVVEEDAKTYTNAVNAANAYTDAQIRAIPSPDFSPSNTTLVATIEAVAPEPDFSSENAALVATIEEVAPVPGDYATVSNKAMTALQSHQSLADYYNKTETDAKIVELAPAPGNYSVVSNKAMTALQSYTETDPTIYSWAKASSKPTYSLNDVAPSTENWLGVPGTTAGGKSIKVLAKTVNGVIEGGMTVTGSSNNDNNTTKYRYAGVTVTRTGTATDYLFDATSASGIVRRNELSSLASSSSVTTLSNSVAAIAATVNAENARFVSTNYNSQTYIPSAYVEAKIDGSWLEIWNELTRWNWLTDTYLPTNFYNKSQINSALDDKADRAWGFYDSHTGLYAPEDYTWISSPKIAIAGGLAYSRTVTAEGAVWVLESNGMVAETGGLTNGFFRVSDDEGNALFEIVKGDKRTVGAQANSVQVIGAFVPSKLQIGYAVVAETHPTLQITASLSDPDWYDEDSASCPANVTWSGVSGAYVATVQAKSASATQLFVKAEYQVGGETYIKNVGPISVEGGILCTDGIHKVRPVYNNNSITWEVVQ
jgi:hypothetical protein